jgi:hypothetical protein
LVTKVGKYFKCKYLFGTQTLRNTGSKNIGYHTITKNMKVYIKIKMSGSIKHIKRLKEDLIP